MVCLNLNTGLSQIAVQLILSGEVKKTTSDLQVKCYNEGIHKVTCRQNNKTFIRSAKLGFSISILKQSTLHLEEKSDLIKGK